MFQILREMGTGPFFQIACGVRVLALLPIALVTTVAAADVTWRPAPVLAEQFLPPGPLRARYELSVSEAAIDACIAVEGTGFESTAFRREQVAPTDGFGTIGGYDRAALAKLFGARRVTVARGPRLVGGRVVASVTLLSPYPDPTLTRLLPGTLRIVTRLVPAAPVSSP